MAARIEVEGESDGLSERLANLNRGLAAADDRIDGLEQELGRSYDRQAELERLASDPANREGPASPERTAHRPDRNEQRDAALAAIDRNSEAFLSGDSGERVEQLVRKPEPGNLTAATWRRSPTTTTGRRS